MRYSPARGFTLIEVLVAVAVIAMLTGLGIASYRRFDSTRKVEAAAVGFGTFLRTAQKKADAGERITACVGILTGYWVNVASQITAEEFALCPSPEDASSHTLGHGAEFDNTSFAVTFNTNSKGVDSDFTAGDNITHITMTGTPTTFEINVDAGGAITVQKI